MGIVFEEKKMSQETACPACLSAKNSIVKKIPDYPAIIFPVDEGLVESIDVKTLTIHRCSDCNHLFQKDIDLLFNEKIYTEYYKYYPYNEDEYFAEHYRLPFEKMFSSLFSDGEEKRLLEIGVSSGEQLKLFERFGFESKGITPQKIKDQKIIRSFYEDHNFNIKFDVVVSRFNMEHIIDLDVFLEKVSNDLCEGGFFVAQVPNAAHYMSENILNFYAHEHVHYFTMTSMSALLERHGFVIEAMRSYHNPSIIVAGRKTSEVQISFDKYVKKSCAIADAVMSLFSQRKRIILYGASLSLSELLYDKGLKEANASEIIIIDDNPVMENMSMPLFRCRIIPYEKSIIAHDDIILLLLNPMYHRIIVEKIRGGGHQNRIYSLCSSGFKELE
jgi:hypothetical protein